MNVEISLFGFGDERPRTFGTRDHLALTLAPGISITEVLGESGFKSQEGLTVMLNNKLVQSRDWSTTTLHDGGALTVLLAIEGG